MNRRARRTAGFTLIELTVVLVIIGIAASSAVLGFRALERVRVKSAALSILGAARFAYTRAVTQHRTVRLVIDMDANPATLAVEESDSRIALARSDDERRTESDRPDDAASDPWAAAEARLREPMHATLGASPFHTVQDNEGNTITRYQTRALGSSIRAVRFFASHEPVPRESGKAAIFFFPGGRASHAVLWLTDGDRTDRESFFSIEIHPVTGRGTIQRGAVEPEGVSEDASAEERSEVDD